VPVAVPTGGGVEGEDFLPSLGPKGVVGADVGMGGGAVGAVAVLDGSTGDADGFAVGSSGGVGPFGQPVDTGDGANASTPQQRNT